MKPTALRLENQKNPDTCNVFSLYKLLEVLQKKLPIYVPNTKLEIMATVTLKQALFELIVEKFKTEREKYNYYINNLEEVDKLLLEGAAKASAVANGVLKRVREKLGY